MSSGQKVRLNLGITLTNYNQQLLSAFICHAVFFFLRYFDDYCVAVMAKL